VSTGHLLMHLNRRQEGTSLVHNFLVLYRNHLVEINRLPVVPQRRLLIAEPDLPGAEGLEMVPCAQLVIENLELLLDLGVVAAWARVQLLLL